MESGGEDHGGRRSVHLNPEGGIMAKRLLSLFRNLFRKRAIEQALDDELRSTLEVLTQEKVKQGLSQAVARREALIEIGGIEQVKEGVRVVRAGHFVEVLAGDIRYGLRRLRRNRSFTAVAALTLALGIGGTTAIFSVVNGVLLQALPYSHPGRLVEVGLDLPGINQFNWPLSPAEYFTFREQSRTFEDIGLYYTGFGGNLYSANVTGLGRPEHVPALGVTDGVLSILEVTPLLGRPFTRADDEPGSADTVMITYGYWRSKFSGDHSVIGKTIDIDGKPSTIIGVLPQRFRFLDMTDLGILLPLRPRTQRGYNYFAVARLKPGVTLAEANADVARLLRMQVELFPEAATFFKETQIRPNLQPLKQYIIGDIGKVLWVLMGGIGLVLLIACANVASLLLVRVEGRQQELAIRAALGGSPGRIAGSLLLESLVLAVIGGALGLLFAYGGLRVLIALAPSDLPRLNDIGIDGLVLLFTLGVTIVAGLLFGSMPALRYGGVRVGTGLRDTGRSVSASRERHRARNALVVIQVGLALVLLVSSGLMIRTFQSLDPRAARIHGASRSRNVPCPFSSGNDEDSRAAGPYGSGDCRQYRGDSWRLFCRFQWGRADGCRRRERSRARKGSPASGSTPAGSQVLLGFARLFQDHGHPHRRWPGFNLERHIEQAPRSDRVGKSRA